MQDNIFACLLVAQFMEPTTALKRGMKNIQDPADLSCYFQINGVHTSNISKQRCWLNS